MSRNEVQGLRKFNLVMGFTPVQRFMGGQQRAACSIHQLSQVRPCLDLSQSNLIGDLRFARSYIFLLLSAVAHFFLASVDSRLYVRNLEKGIIRYITYAETPRMIIRMLVARAIWAR